MSTEITIHGNLVAEPTIACVGEKGTALSKLRVASSRRRRTDEKDEHGKDVWLDFDQLYIDVNCWGDLAVNVKASLFRGSPVVVTGRLVTESWEETGEDGKTVNRSRITMRASRVAFDLSNFQINSRKTTSVSHTVEGTEEVQVKSLEDLLERNSQPRESAEDQLPPRKPMASSFGAASNTASNTASSAGSSAGSNAESSGDLVGAAAGVDEDGRPF